MLIDHLLNQKYKAATTELLGILEEKMCRAVAKARTTVFNEEFDGDEELDSEPDEEDITTPDHQNFYYLGRHIASSAAECKSWMKQHNWFPTVWFISDHGNAHVTNLDEERIVECPDCDGQGTTGHADCPRCKGKGEYVAEARFNPVVAPAARVGQTLATRQKYVNNYFGGIGGKYWPHIPLDAMFAKLREHGFEPVQEDETPWEGFLLGRDGTAKIKLNTTGDKGQPMSRWLVVTYHKMDVSGNYEVTAYIS